MTQKLFTSNFVLLILGQITSLFGNFILKLALSMYVLDMIGSAAVFAGILSVATIPTILLTPFGGILADRVNRRKLMVALDAVSGVSVLVATFLLSGRNAIAVISVLLVALSVLGAFETPTVQACIPTMLQGDNITKGNALVNQIASLSYLIAPLAGGVLYTVFGLKPVMAASVSCFFFTAIFECFIKLEYQRLPATGGMLSVIREDFFSSMQYVLRKETSIGKMLLLIACSRFFVMGILTVGLPYMVRMVLGMNAKYYGGAESALAIATIAGSVAAGLLTEKWNIHRLYRLLVAIGVFMIPAGLVFLLPVGSMVKYIAIIVSLCGMQVIISIFSIFVVSLIQQRTPNHFIGKVMAYVSTVTLCVQPVGQVAYGFWFDRSGNAVSSVLILSGIAVCVVGTSARGFFHKMEKELNVTNL